MPKARSSVSDAKKAFTWLSKHPKVLLKRVGRWICVSTNHLLSEGRTLNAALRKASEKPALIMKVPDAAVTYAVRHHIR